MKPRLKLTKLGFAVCMVSFTLGCVAVGLLWGYEPMHTFHCGLGGLDADWVHITYPGSLVDPATFGAGSEVDLFDWKLAEIKMRLALVAGSWLLGIAVLWFVHRGSRRSVVLEN